MATVVIIHAADDALPARALAEKLRQAKLTVIVEKPPGEELRSAVKSAQTAVALWSPRSVADAAMAEDVSFARGKTKLVHACMQNTAVPDAFRGDKSANLTGWRGEDDFAGWRDLAKLVTERAGVAPLPPPTPRPASGFFTPGLVKNDATGGQPGQSKPAPRRANAPPPPPPRQAQQSAARAPAPRQAPRPVQQSYAPEPEREKKGGGMMMIVIAVVVLAVAGGGGYFWWSQQQGAQTASTAWESVDRNDAAALRAFIAAQSGPVKAQAESALSELEERSFEAASDTDTAEALQVFLRDFPDSQHALAARGRIAELQANASNGAPATTTATDQPANPDLNPPGSTATTTAAPTGGGPAPLTPPGEPSNSQEPPNAPAP